MKVKGLRWWVIALIALATVINYIDRQALVVLWPSISEDLYPDKTIFLAIMGPFPVFLNTSNPFRKDF